MGIPLPGSLPAQLATAFQLPHGLLGPGPVVSHRPSIKHCACSQTLPQLQSPLLDLRPYSRLQALPLDSDSTPRPPIYPGTVPLYGFLSLALCPMTACSLSLPAARLPPPMEKSPRGTWYMLIRSWGDAAHSCTRRQVTICLSPHLSKRLIYPMWSVSPQQAVPGTAPSPPALQPPSP